MGNINVKAESGHTPAGALVGWGAHCSARPQVRV